MKNADDIICKTNKTKIIIVHASSTEKVTNYYHQY